MIEKSKEVISSIALAVELFFVDNITVIAGRNQLDGSMFVIHPTVIDENMNDRLANMLRSKE